MKSRFVIWFFLVLLVFHGCFGRVGWSPSNHAECDPSLIEQIQNAKLWGETFGKEGALGCLRISWEGPQPGATSKPIRISKKGLVTDYKTTPQNTEQTVTFTVPKSGQTAKRKFQIFAFGRALIDTKKAIAYCNKEMAKIDYKCELEEEKNCWFTWVFQPKSNTSSIKSAPLLNGKTCQIIRPKTPQFEGTREPTAEISHVEPIEFKSEQILKEQKKPTTIREQPDVSESTASEPRTSDHEPSTTPDHQTFPEPQTDGNTQQCTGPNWGTLAGGKDSDLGKAIVSDPIGNTYVVGSFSGKVIFGTSTLNSIGPNFFIAKFSPQGKALWGVGLKSLGSFAGSVSLGPQGNIFVTGRSQSAGVIGTKPFTAIGGFDVFVAKLNPQGTVLWATSAGGKDNDESSAIAVDAQGNTYIVGSFTNQMKIGSQTIKSTGFGAFLAKLDPQGKFVGALSLFPSGRGNSFAKALVVNPAGQIYILGLFEGSMSITINSVSTGITSEGGKDLFVLKVSPSRKPNWLRTMGGTNDELLGGIAINSKGNVFIAGTFHDNFTHAGGNILYSNKDGLFILELFPTGQEANVHSASGSKTGRQVNAVTIDKKDNVYLTGRFFNTSSFGKETVTSNGKEDVFVTKFASRFKWSASFGNADTNIGFGITTDNAGRIYVTGRSFGNLTANGKKIQAQGQSDIFVYSFCAP